MFRYCLALQALILVLFWPAYAHADTIRWSDGAYQGEPRLDSLATQLVGQPTTVQCVPPDPLNDAAGWVILPEPIIYLDGRLCGSLLNVLKGSPRSMRWVRSFDGGQDVGYAFLALVHESTHLIEYHGADPTLAYDEGLTECTAWRNTWPYLKLLGLDHKARKSVYLGAYNYHYGKPTTGINASYRSRC